MKDYFIIGMDYWVWNGLNGFFECFMLFGLLLGYLGVSYVGRFLVVYGVVVYINSSINFYGVVVRFFNILVNGWISVNKKLVYDVKFFYGFGFLEEDWEELSFFL